MPKPGSVDEVAVRVDAEVLPGRGYRKWSRRELGTHRSKLHDVAGRRVRVELQRRRRRARGREREIAPQRERGRIGRHQELAIVALRQPERDRQVRNRRTGHLPDIQAGRETEANVAVELRRFPML